MAINIDRKYKKENQAAQDVFATLCLEFELHDVGYIITQCLIKCLAENPDKDITKASNMLNSLNKNILATLALEGFK